jgi:hypothetical protein
MHAYGHPVALDALQKVALLFDQLFEARLLFLGIS